MLKALNDENSDMLRKAKVMVDRVKEEVANSRINRMTIVNDTNNNLIKRKHEK